MLCTVEWKQAPPLAWPFRRVSIAQTSVRTLQNRLVGRREEDERAFTTRRIMHARPCSSLRFSSRHRLTVVMPLFSAAGYPKNSARFNRAQCIGSVTENESGGDCLKTWRTKRSQRFDCLLYARSTKQKADTVFLPFAFFDAFTLKFGRLARM